MKNSFKNLSFTLFFLLFFFINTAYSLDDFNFEISKIEILENGNIFKGLERGTITTSNGLILTADFFEYNKLINVVNAKGNVQIEDKVKDYKIFAEEITYVKNQEKIFTKGKTNAIMESKYTFESKNVIFFRIKEELRSNNKTIVKDDQLTSYTPKKLAMILVIIFLKVKTSR